MSAFVVVRRYSSLEEARVAWSFLQACGIPAELDDHETCSTVWKWGICIGVGLRIPSSQVEDAGSALDMVDRGEFAIEDVEPLSRSTSSRVKTLSLFLS